MIYLCDKHSHELHGNLQQCEQLWGNCMTSGEILYRQGKFKQAVINFGAAYDAASILCQQCKMAEKTGRLSEQENRLVTAAQQLINCYTKLRLYIKRDYIEQNLWDNLSITSLQ